MVYKSIITSTSSNTAKKVLNGVIYPNNEIAKDKLYLFYFYKVNNL